MKREPVRTRRGSSTQISPTCRRGAPPTHARAPDSPTVTPADCLTQGKGGEDHDGGVAPAPKPRQSWRRSVVPAFSLRRQSKDMKERHHGAHGDPGRTSPPPLARTRSRVWGGGGRREGRSSYSAGDPGGSNDTARFGGSGQSKLDVTAHPKAPGAGRQHRVLQMPQLPDLGAALKKRRNSDAHSARGAARGGVPAGDPRAETLDGKQAGHVLGAVTPSNGRRGPGSSTESRGLDAPMYSHTEEHSASSSTELESWQAFLSSYSHTRLPRATPPSPTKHSASEVVVDGIEPSADGDHDLDGGSLRERAEAASTGNPDFAPPFEPRIELSVSASSSIGSISATRADTVADAVAPKHDAAVDETRVSNGGGGGGAGAPLPDGAVPLRAVSTNRATRKQATPKSGTARGRAGVSWSKDRQQAGSGTPSPKTPPDSYHQPRTPEPSAAQASPARSTGKFPERPGTERGPPGASVGAVPQQLEGLSASPARTASGSNPIDGDGVSKAEDPEEPGGNGGRARDEGEAAVYSKKSNGGWNVPEGGPRDAPRGAGALSLRELMREEARNVRRAGPSPNEALARCLSLRCASTGCRIAARVQDFLESGRKVGGAREGAEANPVAPAVKPGQGDSAAVAGIRSRGFSFLSSVHRRVAYGRRYPARPFDPREFSRHDPSR